MPGLASPDFSAALKEYYLGPLNDNVTRMHVFLDRVQKTSEFVDGEYSYIPIIKSRNPSVGSRSDTSGSGPKLPTSGRQGYDVATFKMSYHYGRGQISGPAMRSSKTKAGAFAQALDVEMQGLMESLPEDLNRQIWSYGHGRAGTLAADGASGVTFQFDANSHFNVKIGDRVHFADRVGVFGGVVPANGTTVANITRDQATNQHQVILTATTGAAVTATADALYFGSVASGGVTSEDSSRANEMFGIPALVGTGAVAAEESQAGDTNEFLHADLDFGNIDRTNAANAIWRAQRLRNPSSPGTLRALTNGILQQAWLSAINLGGAKEQSIEIFTNPGIWATWGLLHVGDRRYNDYQKKLEAGWVFLEYNGTMVFYDRDADRNIIWFLHMKDILLLSQSGYELMDEDGNVLFRVTDRDAYEFTLYKDIQLGAKRCSTHVRLEDIQAVANIEAII